MIELSRALAEDITKISGVNEELLGSATDDKAGILSMLRQGASLTTLQTILTKPTTLNVFTARSAYKLSERIFPKVKSAAFLDTMLIPASLRVMHLNMQWLSKKGITQLQAAMELQQRFTSVKSECQSATSQS